MMGQLFDRMFDHSSLQVDFAEDAAARDACYALRYRVYVEEQERQPPLADHVRKLDRNADDATGLILQVRSDVVLGTLRIHHGSVTGIPPFVREACVLPDDAEALREVAAISRLAIAPEHRGGKVVVALLRHAFEWLQQQQTRQLYILALDEPKLLALYKVMGFRPLQPERRYTTDLGPTVPMLSTLKAR